MKIYVVRHGTTILNEKGIINGQIDDELSESGKNDAKELVKTFTDKKIDQIYCSTLKRSINTAKLIAKDHNCPLIEDKRIMEVDFGTFSGKPWESVSSFYPEPNSSEMLNTYNYDLTKFGGESYKDVEKRVNNFIEDLKNAKDKTSLIVTHGGVIRWFYQIILNQQVKTFPNGSIHEFTI